MKIIVHIGWHKTGTTSIQRFLFQNAINLIRGCGIYYPNECLFSLAHHNIPWALQGKVTTPWGNVPLTRKEIKAKLKSAAGNAVILGCNTIIISSEEFCTLQKQEIQALHEILQDLASEVIIIVYLRRQDLLIESSYNMAVKWWGSRITSAFHEYIMGKQDYPNYHAILNIWKNIFGPEALLIRSYEIRHLDLKDVRIDFCKLVGISVNDVSIDRDITNDSLGPSGVEFVRIMNNLVMPKNAHATMVNKILKFEREIKSGPCVFFSPEERMQFLRLHENSNHELHSLGFDVESFTFNPSENLESNVVQLSLDGFRDLFQLSLT